MKDILITATIRSEADRSACKTIATGLQKQTESVKQLLESTWLLTGHKSFEIAISILQTLNDNNLPVVAVEIESVLFSSRSEKD